MQLDVCRLAETTYIKLVDKTSWQSACIKPVVNLKQTCYHQARARDANASRYQLGDCQVTSLQQTCCNLWAFACICLVHDCVLHSSSVCPATTIVRPALANTTRVMSVYSQAKRIRVCVLLVIIRQGRLPLVHVQRLCASPRQFLYFFRRLLYQLSIRAYLLARELLVFAARSPHGVVEPRALGWNRRAYAHRQFVEVIVEVGTKTATKAP